MSFNWNQSAEQKYQEVVCDQLRSGCRVLLILCLTICPAFAVLDYFKYTPFVKELWLNRAITVSIYVFFYLYARKKQFSPYSFGLIALAIISISITHMCYITGGHESTYYAGINLVLLGAVLILPANWRKITQGFGVVIAIYQIGMLIKNDFVFTLTADFLNNLYFMLSTVVIAVLAIYQADSLKRESFARYLSAEESKNELRRSKELLQLELKSEQDNVGSLVSEITQRKTDLENALHLRDEFISSASHELKTPLTSLKLQTEIIQRKFPELEKVDTKYVPKLIKTYDQQLKRLIHIVGDMLDISRIKSGTLEMIISEVNLNAQLREIIESVADGPEAPPMTLKFDEEIIGHWDAFRLEQVFLNLLSNASKYGEQKLIEVIATKEADFAVIKFIDQGIGIAAEDYERIFERFERAVLTREYSGLGLGLHISYQIVKAHKGTIEVQSELGKGSIFTVRLPLK